MPKYNWEGWLRLAWACRNVMIAFAVLILGLVLAKFLGF